MDEVAEPETHASARLGVGALRERSRGEHRVALTPDTVARLRKAGLDVMVEEGAGAAAQFRDSQYVAAGAAVVSHEELIARSGVVLTVGTLSAEQAGQFRAAQAVIGMFRPLTAPDLVRQLAGLGATMISLDGLPRTVPRAQAMDALSSQANVAGYKSALLAADTYGRFFPMLITAAGTAKPADVLVLGAGVAGLQAMGTAHRIGAVVTGYDVRPEARGQIESVGAHFLELQAVDSGAGEGGYARALTAEEQAAQQDELAAHIAHFDVVITTAQVPGRRPPVLVTAAAIAAMRAGSVIVDLGAGPLGGNVETSVADETIVTANGVAIVGAGNLPSQVPGAASVAYSHNVSALLLYMLAEGALHIDLSDEIQAGVVITYGGEVVHPGVRAVVAGAAAAAGVR